MKSQFFYRFVAKSPYLKQLILNLGDKNSNIRDLSKKINVSYTHLSIILQAAHQEGIIDREMVKHNYEFKLTEKGRVLRELCKGIIMVIENWEDGKTQNLLDKLEFLNKEEDTTDPESPDNCDEAEAVVTPATSEVDENATGSES